MTKQEAIEKAYGSSWPILDIYVDKNGWCNNCWNLFVALNGDVKPNSNGSKWRPKSLKGIENNNGWIKIESEADLPKTIGGYWIKDNQGITNIFFNGKSFMYSTEIEALTVTHYQPIIKPEPPLY